MQFLVSKIENNGFSSELFYIARDCINQHKILLITKIQRLLKKLKQLILK